MDYLLTEKELELKELFRSFAEKEVAPLSKTYDKSGEFPWELFKKAAALGMTTLHLPEKYGGNGGTAMEQALLMEELARTDAGFAVAVGACDLAMVPVLMAGTEEQKHKFADRLLAGKAAAFCLTEAEAGSDAAALRTTAIKDGEDYVLNGSKCFITNGGIADIYTVFATVDPSLGARGITAFIVERERKGVSVGKEEDKMGIRLSNTTEVIFQDVRVPASNIVGNVGQGMKIALETLDRTRGTDAPAGALGIAQACIDHALAYAKERKTFGRPIVKNQGIQFMLADMEIQTQAARQMIRSTARMIDQGIVDSKITAATKAFASDIAVQVALDAIQILGGYGYSREYPVEKLLRDAKIYQIFEGTNQVQRMVIANAMVKGK